MTVGEIMSIIGGVIGVASLIGGLIARDRQMFKAIDVKTAAVDEKYDRETKTLHERVNRTRDEMVRQADLQSHTQRIEGTLGNIQVQLNLLIQKFIKE